MIHSAANGLAKFELVLWYVSLLLELMVCALALRRHFIASSRSSPDTSPAVLVRGIVMYGIYRSMGYTSRPAFYSFWITQAASSPAGSVDRRARVDCLAPYLGLRVVIKWLVAAHFSDSLNSRLMVKRLRLLPPSAFVLALERDLELTAAIVLLLLLSSLCITRSY